MFDQLNKITIMQLNRSFVKLFSKLSNLFLIKEIIRPNFLIKQILFLKFINFSIVNLNKL